MTPEQRSVSIERLQTRLRRLEQQIRVFKELHASEMQIILEEIADITAEVEAARDTETPAPEVAAPADDPAASSPKRAKWLAEQQRPVSRRELLRGRGEGS